MNEDIFDLWLASGKYSLAANSDEETIRFFLRYMDKHSLRLADATPPLLSFTNDAQTIRFSEDEIYTHVKNLKAGISFPWESYRD